MPIFDPEGTCPLLKKKCIKHRCIWYNMLQGNHPQSGAPVQRVGLLYSMVASVISRK